MSSNSRVVALLASNLHLVDWSRMSRNPEAIDILREHRRMVHPHHLIYNKHYQLSLWTVGLANAQSIVCGISNATSKVNTWGFFRKSYGCRFSSQKSRIYTLAIFV